MLSSEAGADILTKLLQWSVGVGGGTEDKNYMRRRDVDGRHFTEKNSSPVKDDFKVHTLKA